LHIQLQLFVTAIHNKRMYIGNVPVTVKQRKIQKITVQIAKVFL